VEIRKKESILLTNRQERRMKVKEKIITFILLSYHWRLVKRMEEEIICNRWKDMKVSFKTVTFIQSFQRIQMMISSSNTKIVFSWTILMFEGGNLSSSHTLTAYRSLTLSLKP